MNSSNSDPEEIRAGPKRSITSDEEKKFPLPTQEQTRFETNRTLVGLYKQEPLETNQQFAERIVREMQEYLAKSRQGTNTPKPDKES